MVTQTAAVVLLARVSTEVAEVEETLVVMATLSMAALSFEEALILREPWMRRGIMPIKCDELKAIGIARTVHAEPGGCCPPQVVLLKRCQAVQIECADCAVDFAADHHHCSQCSKRIGHRPLRLLRLRAPPLLGFGFAGPAAARRARRKELATSPRRVVSIGGASKSNLKGL